ncbi:hypothetical protein [Methanobrevibacter ruminantium]|uniref:hypothetical protein n=1 Tax=Methanobrevibacter ruminantium TaxID=83816 RepID=UPI0026EFC00C|nr:hypothetical protein [Methanobrevibacter ruminantium]
MNPRHEIKFFTKEFFILIGIVIGIPTLTLILAWHFGYYEIGMGLFGAILGASIALIGSYYTNYVNKKNFEEEKNLSKNLLHDQINMEKQRDSVISINKKLTKIISNSDMFQKTMILSEYNTLDEVILSFILFEKDIWYKNYYNYGENYFEYVIHDIGEEIYTMFKEEIMNFDEIIYLPQVLREEIVYWTNNFSVVIGTKENLKDNSPYIRFGEDHYYPVNMNYKALYTDLKIICAIVWRDTNSFLLNNIELTTRDEINNLFEDDLKEEFLMQYCVFNEFEDEDTGIKSDFTIGKSLVKKDIFETLLGELYIIFKNRE